MATASAVAAFAGGPGGRDRGKLAGGVFISGVSYVCTAFSLAYPGWLSGTIQQGGAALLCQNQTGLWELGRLVGNDIPNANPAVVCSNTEGTSWRSVGSKELWSRVVASRVLLIVCALGCLAATCAGARAMVSGTTKRFAVRLGRLAWRASLLAAVAGCAGWGCFWNSWLYNGVDVGQGRFGCFSRYEINYSIRPVVTYRCQQPGASFFFAIVGWFGSLLAAPIFALTTESTRPQRRCLSRSWTTWPAFGCRGDETATSNDGGALVTGLLDESDDEDIGSAYTSVPRGRLWTTVFGTPFPLSNPSGGRGTHRVEAGPSYSLFAAGIRWFLRQRAPAQPSRKQNGEDVADRRAPSAMRALAVVVGCGFLPPFAIVLIEALFVWGMTDTIGGLKGSVVLPRGQSYLLFDVFQMNMFTMLSVFANSSSWLLFFVVGFFCMVLPIVAMNSLLISFFLPATEKLRARVIRACESALGMSFATVHILIIVAVMNHIDFTLRNTEIGDPLLPNTTHNLTGFLVEGGAYPDLGALLYSVSVFVALVFTRMFLLLHDEMEDHRRAKTIVREAEIPADFSSFSAASSPSMMISDRTYSPRWIPPLSPTPQQLDISQSDLLRFVEAELCAAESHEDTRGAICCRQLLWRAGVPPFTSGHDDSNYGCDGEDIIGGVKEHDQQRDLKLSPALPGPQNEGARSCGGLELRVTPLGNVVFGGICAVSVTLTVVGAFVPVFERDVQGAARQIIPDSEGTRQYSLVDIGTEFWRLVPISLGERGFYTIVWFVLVTVAPVCHAIAVLTLWFRTMTLTELNKWVQITEVLRAWSTLEALVVIFGAASVDIAELSDAIIAYSLGDYDAIVPCFISPLIFELRFLPAIGFIIVGSVLILFTSRLTTMAAKTCLHRGACSVNRNVASTMRTAFGTMVQDDSEDWRDPTLFTLVEGSDVDRSFYNSALCVGAKVGILMGCVKATSSTTCTGPTSSFVLQ